MAGRVAAGAGWGRRAGRGERAAGEWHSRGKYTQMVSSGPLWVVGKMGNFHFLQKCVGLFLGHRKEMRPDTK